MSQVLDLDEFNVKALFRRSQAYLKTSELEKANNDLKRALAIDPDNRYMPKPFTCKHYIFVPKVAHVANNCFPLVTSEQYFVIAEM